ncbi:Uncharacterised protein [Nocardia farcinica]|nr:Uncharacterised protein [Nocardia farcinica]
MNEILGALANGLALAQAASSIVLNIVYSVLPFL